MQIWKIWGKSEAHSSHSSSLTYSAGFLLLISIFHTFFPSHVKVCNFWNNPLICNSTIFFLSSLFSLSLYQWLPLPSLPNHVISRLDLSLYICFSCYLYSSFLVSSAFSWCCFSCIKYFNTYLQWMSAF